jgi:hypothetical protein
MKYQQFGRISDRDPVSVWDACDCRKRGMNRETM